VAERGIEGARPRLTPAMADLRRTVREWAEDHSEDTPPSYLVALSGGGDSAALAWACSIELPKLGLKVGAVIVDHQLQDGSTDIAERAARQAKGWGLSPVMIKTVSVQPGAGPEDSARVARYQALTEALHETGSRGILLAHTQDDQAETVLLGLARGSGPASLQGMPVEDGPLHRPLLGFSREALRQALGDAGETWWDDPHNRDDRFARVRVRRDVLPVLERELGPGVAQSLARSAELARQDSEFLDGLAQALFELHALREESGVWSIGVSALEQQPLALRSRVLRKIAKAAGAPSLGYGHTTDMLSLVSEWKGQGELSLPGLVVWRKAGNIYARMAPQGDNKGATQ
jgi:tRNA(Ile)-lysidine synthase